MIQKALDDSGVGLRQIAKDAGVNYGTLRHWAAGLRTPLPEHLKQLAAGLRLRSEKLAEIADELERVDT